MHRTSFCLIAHELNVAGKSAQLVLVKGSPTFVPQVNFLSRIWQSVFHQTCFDSITAVSSLIQEANDTVLLWSKVSSFSPEQLQQVDSLLSVLTATKKMFPQNQVVLTVITRLRAKTIETLTKDASPSTVKFLFDHDCIDQAWAVLKEKPAILDTLPRNYLERIKDRVYSSRDERAALVLYKNGIIDTEHLPFIAETLLRKNPADLFCAYDPSKKEVLKSALSFFATFLQSCDPEISARLKQFRIEIPKDLSEKSLEVLHEQFKKFYTYLPPEARGGISSKNELLLLLDVAERTNFVSFFHLCYHKMAKSSLAEEEQAIKTWLKSPAAHKITCLQARGPTFWYIPDEIRDLTGLQDLNVQDCNLETIPASIGDLINLRELDLSLNKLHDLPDTIKNLVHLESLSVTSNQLSSLPSLHNLSALKVLKAAGNKLGSWPAGVETLSSLEECILFSNKLTSLPAVLGRLPNLSTLRLEENCIREVSLSGFNALTTLALFQNKLENFSIAPSSLRKLEQLLLQGNKLQKILGIEQCTQLKELDVRYNLLTEVPLIDALTYLLVIKLNQNPIERLPESVFSKSLKIEISESQLSLFPKNLLPQATVNYYEREPTPKRETTTSK